MHTSMKPLNLVFVIVAVLFILPSVASANAGTPLMWASLFHLWIGNALIGFLEGTILALVFRVSHSRAVLLMVLANYFSAWLGWHWISNLSFHKTDFDLYNASQFIWKMFAVTYFATIVLEWPFVAGCFWRTSHWFRRSWIASVMIQSTSYLLLFGLYQWASVNSLLTDTEIVTPDQIALPSDVRIYFISDADGHVYTRRLTGGKATKVFDVHSIDFADCLSLNTFGRESDLQQLVVLKGLTNRLNTTMVQLGITLHPGDCPLDESGRPLEQRRFPSPSEGIAAKLGSATSSPWSCKAGYWPVQGLSGENSQSGAHFRIALEVPFIQWQVRHPILLPGDVVLFQLGNRQICIYHPDTKKLAVIERGRGAIAVMDTQSSSNE